MGVSPSAKFPTIASLSFRRGHTARRLAKWLSVDVRSSVVLWTDSFNNAFSPQVLEDAVSVLEHYGLGVRIMQRHICCGRPFYDAGMLDQAKANLRAILDQLEALLVDACANRSPRAKLPVGLSR
jgi:Fe-S oxidoreductase